MSLKPLPESKVGRGFPKINLERIPNGQTGMGIGDLPPNFTLMLDNGQRVQLHELQGQPILINFWATWCGPCRLEMPDIVEQSEAHEDLIVLAVNVGEGLEEIEPFVGVVHFSWIDRFTLLETERTFIFSDFAGSQRENGLI
ncbi:TlpA family protein disulfide reductase [Chloroflexi bacterium TSY]|nr:TlpA family protein disulfide reductase [Chloroflexi bacterium TSY]